MTRKQIIKQRINQNNINIRYKLFTTFTIRCHLLPTFQSRVVYVDYYSVKLQFNGISVYIYIYIVAISSDIYTRKTVKFNEMKQKITDV